MPRMSLILAGRIPTASTIPTPQAAARFGTCYLGASLAVALAETLYHDRKPIHNHFMVGLAVIQARFVIRLTGETLPSWPI